MWTDLGGPPKIKPPKKREEKKILIGYVTLGEPKLKW